MRKLFNLLTTSVVVSIGIELGTKLWNEVLEGKIDELKNRLTTQD